MGTPAARYADKSKHIRLTRTQDARLDEACAYLGTTYQGFAHEAILVKLAKVEAEMREDAAYEARTKRRGGDKKREVRGLGLRQEDTREMAAPEPAPPAPVVVNVGASAPVTEMTMLADFVCKGTPLMRSARLEQARTVISASLDPSAREAAIAALDAAIAAREAREPEGKRAGVLDWLKA